MTPTHYVLFGIGALAQIILGIRWLHIKARNAEVQSAFVRDMARNHLPHIYHVLKLLCEDRSIEVSEPPPIEFVQFNGKK